MYKCPKCKRVSGETGGRPICCHCGKLAPKRGKLLSISPAERFAFEYAVDIDRVPVLTRLANECAKLGEYECNGDQHPHNPDPSDKSASAKLWGHARDVAAAELLRYAERFGFVAVDFAGLRPCLRDKAGRYVEIPH